MSSKTDVDVDDEEAMCVLFLVFCHQNPHSLPDSPAGGEHVSPDDAVRLGSRKRSEIAACPSLTIFHTSGPMLLRA